MPDRSPSRSSAPARTTRRTAVRTAARGSALLLGAQAALAAGAGRAVAAGTRTYQRYVTRPDLRPVEVVVTRTSAAARAGGVFTVAPKLALGNWRRRRMDEARSGPTMFDADGELVYFHGTKRGLTPFDFRVQALNGQPVLTYWEGTTSGGHGPGEGVVLNQAYHEIGRVRMTGGLKMDFHDFRLTPQGTALLMAYDDTTADLRSVGGPRSGRIFDNVIQEIDLATGRTLLEWRMSDHVRFSESYFPRPEDAKETWDVFHMNSVYAQDERTLLTSCRHTHAIYAIDRRSGKLLWRLGGKKSDFAMGKGAAFSWQHDAQRRPDGTLTLFDNHTSTYKSRTRSRGLVLRLDEQAMTASVAAEYPHPDARVTSATQGNLDDLENGHMVVGWGSGSRRITQLDAKGKVVFEAEMRAKGYESYRAYRAPWTGRPTTTPDVKAAKGASRTRVWVSWNGATEVASWRILAGASPAALAVVGTVPRRGFETSTTIAGKPASVAVEALDAAGRVLSRSATVKS